MDTEEGAYLMEDEPAARGTTDSTDESEKTEDATKEETLSKILTHAFYEDPECLPGEPSSVDFYEKVEKLCLDVEEDESDSIVSREKILITMRELRKTITEELRERSRRYLGQEMAKYVMLCYTHQQVTREAICEAVIDDLNLGARAGPYGNTEMVETLTNIMRRSDLFHAADQLSRIKGFASRIVECTRRSIDPNEVENVGPRTPGKECENGAGDGQRNTHVSIKRTKTPRKKRWRERYRRYCRSFRGKMGRKRDTLSTVAHELGKSAINDANAELLASEYGSSDASSLSSQKPSRGAVSSICGWIRKKSAQLWSPDPCDQTEVSYTAVNSADVSKEDAPAADPLPDACAVYCQSVQSKACHRAGTVQNVPERIADGSKPVDVKANFKTYTENISQGSTEELWGRNGSEGTSVDREQGDDCSVPVCDRQPLLTDQPETCQPKATGVFRFSGSSPSNNERAVGPLEQHISRSPRKQSCSPRKNRHRMSRESPKTKSTIFGSLAGIIDQKVNFIRNLTRNSTSGTNLTRTVTSGTPNRTWENSTVLRSKETYRLGEVFVKEMFTMWEDFVEIELVFLREPKYERKIRMDREYHNFISNSTRKYKKHMAKCEELRRVNAKCNLVKKRINNSKHSKETDVQVKVPDPFSTNWLNFVHNRPLSFDYLGGENLHAGLDHSDKKCDGWATKKKHNRNTCKDCMRRLKLKEKERAEKEMRARTGCTSKTEMKKISSKPEDKKISPRVFFSKTKSVVPLSDSVRGSAPDANAMKSDVVVGTLDPSTDLTLKMERDISERKRIEAKKTAPMEIKKVIASPSADIPLYENSELKHNFISPVNCTPNTADVKAEMGEENERRSCGPRLTTPEKDSKPEVVFQLAEYRMDAHTTTSTCKRGRVTTVKEKQKTRGVPNRHLQRNRDVPKVESQTAGSGDGNTADNHRVPNKQTQTVKFADDSFDSFDCGQEMDVDQTPNRNKGMVAGDHGRCGNDDTRHFYQTPVHVISKKNQDIDPDKTKKGRGKSAQRGVKSQAPPLVGWM